MITYHLKIITYDFKVTNYNGIVITYHIRLIIFYSLKMINYNLNVITYYILKNKIYLTSRDVKFHENFIPFYYIKSYDKPTMQFFLPRDGYKTNEDDLLIKLLNTTTINN